MSNYIVELDGEVLHRKDTAADVAKAIMEDYIAFGCPTKGFASYWAEHDIYRLMVHEDFLHD